MNDDDKPNTLPIARDLAELGFALVATRGTAAYLRAHDLEADVVFKINEGRPHIGDRLLNRELDLVINTPLGRESFFDDLTVRRDCDDARGFRASPRSPVRPPPSAPFGRSARRS